MPLEDPEAERPVEEDVLPRVPLPPVVRPLALLEEERVPRVELPDEEAAVDDELPLLEPLLDDESPPMEIEEELVEVRLDEEDADAEAVEVPLEAATDVAELDEEANPEVEMPPDAELAMDEARAPVLEEVPVDVDPTDPVAVPALTRPLDVDRLTLLSPECGDGLQPRAATAARTNPLRRLPMSVRR